MAVRTKAFFLGVTFFKGSLMIIRIYRVEIKPELREEFELAFQAVAREFVAGRDGLISVQIGRPTEWAPNEYVMTSHWSDVTAVQAFAGEAWGEPVIPEAMQKYTVQCWLHQFESFA